MNFKCILVSGGSRPSPRGKIMPADKKNALFPKIGRGGGSPPLLVMPN